MYDFPNRYLICGCSACFFFTTPTGEDRLANDMEDPILEEKLIPAILDLKAMGVAGLKSISYQSDLHFWRHPKRPSSLHYGPRKVNGKASSA